MKTNLHSRTTFFLTGLLMSIGLSPQAHAETTADRVSRTLFFDQHIVQVGPQQSSEEEAQLVLDLLNAIAASHYTQGFDELEQYLAVRTNSAWAPSLDAAVGKYYFDIGRYTLGLEHWELAWAATRNYESGSGKRIADYTLAHWTGLLARLGRYETLVTIYQENRNRVLDRGPLSQMWARNREALADMRKHPGTSYQCGTFALHSVARELHRRYDARSLLRVPSPATGFSMKALADLSSQLGLGLVAVTRTAGTELVIPSVVHWRQNHYGAIIAQRGDLYQVVDPTFGEPRYMTADTINAEASGNFFVPAERLPPNYRLLTSGETEVIFGRGNPNFLDDARDQPYLCENGEAPPGVNGPGGAENGQGRAGRLTMGSSCSSCSGIGMCEWRVSECYINLWLEDEPLGYSPALGPRESFQLRFKQRDVDGSSVLGTSALYRWSSTVGFSWKCSWLSCVTSGYGAISGGRIAYGQGGAQAFDVYSSNVAGNYYNNLKLKMNTNELGSVTGYELLYPSGARDIYGFAPTNDYGYPGWYFYLSEKVSPDGHSTSFLYEHWDPTNQNVRLAFVIDPDGRTNSISYMSEAVGTNYAGGYGTNLIIGVTDPYGRSVSLGYDTNGLLTSVTDTAGMTSYMQYNELGWVTNLSTPYGTTSFELADKGLDNPESWDRSITITEPNNSKQLYLFLQVPPFESAPSASETPTNTPLGTLDGDPARCSYHWGRLQYVALSTNNWDYLTASDFLKGRMRHWLGWTLHGYARSMDTTYAYNGNRQLIRVQHPSGLTTTNLYFTSGTDANRLQKTIDLEISRTNSYTYYANGLVLSHTDERGLTVTNYWDNLQRLTGTKHPDGTTTSNRYTALSRRARTGWGIGVTPATMGFGKRPPRRMPMESLLVTACANAARCSTSRMPGILRSRS